MTLKEKMKRGPVFGMACFTGTTCVIENIAMSGLDFIYLDLEHTNYMLDEAFEKQIMAAKLHDIAILVRMANDDEVAIRKVLEWGADKPVIGKFFTFCLEKGHKGGEKLKAKAGRGLPWALLLFVGIPLPGTGAWTGTLAASLLDMDFKSSVRACMGGVLLAGCIMGAVSLLGFSAFGAIAG